MFKSYFNLHFLKVYELLQWGQECTVSFSLISGDSSEFSKDSLCLWGEPFKSNDETSGPCQTAFKEAQPGPSNTDEAEQALQADEQ